MTTFLLHRHRRHHRPLSTRAAFSLDGFMSSFISGIGSFTTDTIFAVLRALPETDGTYVQVIARATENGAQLSSRHCGVGRGTVG